MEGLEWRQTWKSTVATVNQELLEQYTESFDYLQPPTTGSIPLLRGELRRLTLLIQFGDRSSFSKRGQIFLNLQLPELACGDFYRAMQLVDNSEQSQIKLLLAQALFMCNSSLECLQIINGGRELSPELSSLHTYARKAFKIEQAEVARTSQKDFFASRLEAHLFDKDLSGDVVVQPYPWMKESWLTRKPSVMSNLNIDLYKQSLGQCQIQKSNVNVYANDCFGIFNTSMSAIPTGSWIFTDETTLCATSGLKLRCDACGGDIVWSSFKLTCCEKEARFCSMHCANTATATYHKPICGLQVGTDSDAGDVKSVAVERLWLRVLASIKQVLYDEKLTHKHPLDVPLINQLTATYGITVRFSLAQDIIKPMETLRSLGVDVYTDLRFDTLVLRVIAVRLDTNMREQAVASLDGFDVAESELIAVNSLYAFCNHSCEPNVDLIVDEAKQSSTIRLRAKKNIGKGEELLISYLDEEDLRLGYEERAALLKSWTGDVCNCSKCEKERTTVDHASDTEYQPDEDSCDEGVM